MKPTVVGLLGKPLAGKDSVAAILTRELPGCVSISIGDVIREVKAEGPRHRFWPLLQGSIAVADAGGIAPDSPVFACITTLIEEKRAEGNDMVVWVGGPRSEDQLTWLDAWTRAKGYEERFVFINTPDDELHARREYRANGGRTDDTPDAFSERLTQYEAVTRPVVDRLKSEGRLIEVKSGGGKEAVGRRAVEALQHIARDPEITLPTQSRR